MATFHGKEQLLTVSEAADYLNVSKVTIRRWTNDGTLPCFRIGARKERRFLESELQELVSGQDAESSPILTTSGTGGAHHCLVCNDSEGEWRAIADAVTGHLSKHSHVVFIGETKRRKRFTTLLDDQGIDVKSLTSSGELRLLSVEKSYLLAGFFSTERAIAFVESTILDAFAKGFKNVLFVGYVDWVFRNGCNDDGSLVEEVMEYEKKLNSMLERYPTVTILCPYVLTRIDSKTIVDAFLAHPKLQLQSDVIDGLYV